MAVFPRYCAPQKGPSDSAADWRSPKSGDQEDDGRPDHPQGAGDPETADGGVRTRRPKKRARPGERCRIPPWYGSGKQARLPWPSVHLALTFLHFAASEEAVAGPERAAACRRGQLFAKRSGSEDADGCVAHVFRCCSSALCRFSIALSPPARNGLWASLRHPVSRGFRCASARGHRKRYFSLFPAHAHFNTFCVLFLEVAFSSLSSSGRFTRTAARLRRTAHVDGLIVCVIALFECPTAVELVSTDIDTSSTWKYTPLATILMRIRCGFVLHAL